MPKYQMEVIPKPKVASILESADPSSKGPFFKGSGTDIYLCGACQAVLVDGIEKSQVQNVVFKCPTCGMYNHLRGT